MVPIPNASSLVNSSDRQNSSLDRSDISITIEVVTLDIPDAQVLSQAFEKIRTLPIYLKPIVMEGLAKKLKVSKKAIDKSFEAWMMERISQIAALDAAQHNSNNGEEV
jgi:hypothetical protein